MSDTPRTDAEYKDHEWDIMDHIPLEFCRQLERELNASLENQVKSMEKLVEQQDFTLKAAVLLSEAVSQRDRAIKIAETLSGGGSRACRELHHAKKDRHESGEVCPIEERIEKAASDLLELKAEIK